MVCITEIVKKGRELFYERDGVAIKINRIYNRIVADELKKQSVEIKEKAEILYADLDVSWVTHPNHFFRISKYLLPLLQHDYIPKTQFVDQIKNIPTNLERYIL